MNSLCFIRGISLFAISLAASASLAAQTTLDYEVSIKQGDALLQAGDAELALASGEAAVKGTPDRWDGYALTGRALLSLKRYEPAADALSKAIELAPQSQQGALRELRRQCLLAESGSAPPIVPAAAVAATAVAPVASVPVVAAQPSTPNTRVTDEIARERSDLNESVWLDQSTGLVWARPWYYPRGATGPWNFADAQSFCSTLGMLGYSNWRLPSSDELQHIFVASSKGWRWSVPQFDPGFGGSEALKRGTWAPASFTVEGDKFQGNRLLLWTSTAGNKPGQHAALYFGRRYSINDDLSVGESLGSSARNPFQGYALCLRATAP